MIKKGETYDVVIVGGGLVGLCAAYHLLDSQFKVGIIMGSHKGSASLAAAGMLAPTCEWGLWMPTTFLDFLRAGRDYYDEFLSHILSKNHLLFEDVNYAKRHFLLLDLIESDKDLSARYESLRSVGAQVDWLNREEICEKERYINPDTIRGGISISEDGVVNPRALHALLIECMIRHQIDLLDANLMLVEEETDKFVLSLDNGYVVNCSQVVIAAGAWSFEVAEKFHLEIPVSPVKGQIVQLSGGTELLKHILYMPVGACGCLLERSPGVYIAGTSEEYISAEATNTSKVVAAILMRINEIFPVAGDFAIDAMWSGFRPITPDELPIISVSSNPRVIVATGHYRNGVLLSPLTGLLVKSLLMGENPEINIQPYKYQRNFHSQYRFASAY